MIKSAIFIPKKKFNDIYRYLIPKKPKYEKVAFVFAKTFITNDSVQFQFIDWYCVQPEEYKCQSLLYVELKDEIRPKIIKKAFDLDASIIELHSHPYQIKACFSYSDFQGFDEFVPHVWWRLNGKPYVAMVFSPFDFDALVWIDNPKSPHLLTELIIGEARCLPNGSSLANIRRQKNEYGTF